MQRLGRYLRRVKATGIPIPAEIISYFLGLVVLPFTSELSRCPETAFVVIQLFSSKVPSFFELRISKAAEGKHAGPMGSKLL